MSPTRCTSAVLLVVISWSLVALPLGNVVAMDPPNLPPPPPHPSPPPPAPPPPAVPVLPPLGESIVGISIDVFGRHFDNVTHAEFADAIADALTLALPTDSLESMLITRIAELAQGTSALPATPTDAVGIRFEVEVLAKSEAVALAMPQPILTVLFAQELTMALQGVMVHKSPAHVSSVGVRRVRLGVLTELATICCTVDQIGRMNVPLNTLTPLVVTDACIACVVAIPRDFGPVIVPNVLPPQVMQRKQKDKSETHPIVIVVIVFLCVIVVAAAAYVGFRRFGGGSLGEWATKRGGREGNDAANAAFAGGAMGMFGAAERAAEPETAKKELPGELHARTNPLALEPIKGENADAHFDL